METILLIDQLSSLFGLILVTPFLSEKV